MQYTIREAVRNDAGFIAKAIMTAIGDDICLELVENDRSRLYVVEQLFSTLAAREDTQYSFRNTLVAEDADGKIVGAIVAYDGAKLRLLRQPFIDLANELTNKHFDQETIDNETSDDEIYIDTLMVDRAARNHGVGTSLIKAMTDRHRGCGKPMGLLVEFNNDRAARVYAGAGFRKVGERPFLGTMMNHLQLDAI